MAEEEILGEGLFHEEREVNQDQGHGENGSEMQVPLGRGACCKYVEWTWNNRDVENERDKEHDGPFEQCNGDGVLGEARRKCG